MGARTLSMYEDLGSVLSVCAHTQRWRLEPCAVYFPMPEEVTSDILSSFTVIYSLRGSPSGLELLTPTGLELDYTVFQTKI